MPPRVSEGMTLIVSAISHRGMYQVSDRRLVTTDGKFFDGQTNKAIIWSTTHAMSYTGLAMLRTAGTTIDSDAWIAMKLQEACVVGKGRAHILDAARHLASSLGSATEIRGVPRRVRTVEIAVVGWTDVGHGATPSFIRISNAAAPGGDGKVECGFLDATTACSWGASGQTVPRQIGSSLERHLLEAVDGDFSPHAILRVIAWHMREVARRNRAVGSDLTGVYLPTTTAGGAAGVYADPSTRNEMLCLTLGATEEEDELFTPAFVDPASGAAISGVTIAIPEAQRARTALVYYGEPPDAADAPSAS